MTKKLRPALLQGAVAAGLACALALFVWACQGAGLNSEGSGGGTVNSAVGPVITQVQIPDSPVPAPAACGTPILPYGLSSGGQTLILTGANFDPASELRVGKLLATITSTSATQINAVVPAGSPGIIDIVVINPDGQLTERTGAIELCADPAATTPTAQAVAGLVRLEIGSELSTEVHTVPGTQDDLRDLRPQLSVAAGGATASIFSGPSPAGADLLIGAAPAVFRYVLIPETAGDLVLNGEANGINSQLGTTVNTGVAQSPVVCVEPIIPQVSLDRDDPTLGQIFRLTVMVPNAGSETVTNLQPEGIDPDGDEGPTPPDTSPTVAGDATLTLLFVTARIEAGTGTCTDSPALPALPSCDVDANSIARFDLTYSATEIGTAVLQANAHGNATGCTVPPGTGLNVVRGITKSTGLITVNP